jgi:hypothetical protein
LRDPDKPILYKNAMKGEAVLSLEELVALFHNKWRRIKEARNLISNFDVQKHGKELPGTSLSQISLFEVLF